MKQFIFIIPILFVVFTACVDENDLKQNQNPIVGQWTYESLEYEIKINNQDIYSYFDSLGLSAENIALFTLLVESEIKAQLEGLSVNFNAANSYEMINEEDEIESAGTYELNAGQNQITLTDENNESFVVEILKLSENSLTLARSENIDGPDEISSLNADLKVDANITFFK